MSYDSDAPCCLLELEDAAGKRLLRLEGTVRLMEWLQTNQGPKWSPGTSKSRLKPVVALKIS